MEARAAEDSLSVFFPSADATLRATQAARPQVTSALHDLILDKIKNATEWGLTYAQVSYAENAQSYRSVEPEIISALNAAGYATRPCVIGLFISWSNPQ